MKKPTFIAWSLGACLVVGVVAYRVGRARADGVPAMNPLYYGGVLNDGGRAVEGTRAVTVRLWDAATAGTTVCTTSAGATTFTGGRFRVALDATCVGAVRANPELWAEVQVEGTVFPRAKLGAVPYALEAGRATAAAGALEARLASIETRAQSRQVEIGVMGGTAHSTSTGTFVVVGTSITFVAQANATYSISAQCVGRGKLSAAIAPISASIPESYRNPTTLIDTTWGSGTFPTTYSPERYVSFGALTVPMTLQAIGSLHNGTAYSFQISATIEEATFRNTSGNPQPLDSSITCGPLIASQLN